MDVGCLDGNVSMAVDGFGIVVAGLSRLVAAVSFLADTKSSDLFVAFIVS